MSRLYDPHNPRMLTREEIARLNPVECAAACEELDQNILSTLQSIDADFADTTRIVTDVLIPIVEKYGSSSKQVWDSVKVSFLELQCYRRDRLDSRARNWSRRDATLTCMLLYSSGKHSSKLLLAFPQGQVE